MAASNHIYRLRRILLISQVSLCRAGQPSTTEARKSRAKSTRKSVHTDAPSPDLNPSVMQHWSRLIF